MGETKFIETIEKFCDFLDENNINYRRINYRKQNLTARKIIFVYINKPTIIREICIYFSYSKYINDEFNQYISIKHRSYIPESFKSVYSYWSKICGKNDDPFEGFNTKPITRDDLTFDEAKEYILELNKDIYDFEEADRLIANDVSLFGDSKYITPDFDDELKDLIKMLDDNGIPYYHQIDKDYLYDQSMKYYMHFNIKDDVYIIFLNTDGTIDKKSLNIGRYRLDNKGRPNLMYIFESPIDIFIKNFIYKYIDEFFLIDFVNYTIAYENTKQEYEAWMRL